MKRAWKTLLNDQDEILQSLTGRQAGWVLITTMSIVPATFGSLFVFDATLPLWQRILAGALAAGSLLLFTSAGWIVKKLDVPTSDEEGAI